MSDTSLSRVDAQIAALVAGTGGGGATGGYCAAFDECMAELRQKEGARAMPWQTRKRRAPEGDDEEDTAEHSGTFAAEGAGSVHGYREEEAASGAGEVAAPTSATAASSSASASTSGDGAAAEKTSVALPDRSRNAWVSRKSDKWECQKAPESRTAPAVNLHIAAELEKLGEHYKSIAKPRDNNDWRSNNASKQAKILRGLSFEVTDARQLADIKGFGEKSIEKIDQVPTSSTRTGDPTNPLPLCYS